VPGVGSRATDLNWYAGTLEELFAYAGEGVTLPPRPATGWRMRVTIPKLNIRSGPGLDYEDLGDLHDGDVLDVLTLSGEDVWIEFEPGKWAAFSLDDEIYMVPETESPLSGHDTEVTSAPSLD
jgi:hypothetical protein